jgi:hypothetical protein
VSPEAAFAGRLDVTMEGLLERIGRRVHLRLSEILALMGLNRHARTARQGERDRKDGTRQGTGHRGEGARRLIGNQARTGTAGTVAGE